MEVYFYCSYEHSQKGFFMTKLMDGQLVPAGSVPEKVDPSLQICLLTHQNPTAD